MLGLKEKIKEHDKYYQFTYAPLVGTRNIMKLSKERAEQRKTINPIIDFFIEHRSNPEFFKDMSSEDLSTFLKLVADIEDGIDQDILRHEAMTGDFDDDDGDGEA